MAEVPSTFVLKIGDKAPEFMLPTCEGEDVGLRENLGEAGSLVAFVCNHCPFVIHLAKELGALASDVQALGVNTLAINSNDVVNYPQDSPEHMRTFARENGWNFPYLFDETQEVAHAYFAACTPDFFLLDSQGYIFYAGQFDASRPNNDFVADGADLRKAIDLLVSGAAPPSVVVPATGCNIKWKSGNEPDYFG